MTEDLTVRPGQTVNSVLFKDYYLKNWKESEYRWVKVFRKSLPTEGVNDTQAAESTFAFIKRDLKRLFPGRRPTMNELISVLPDLLDKRAIKRKRDVNVSTLVIHHPDPYINKGLSLASWKLNVAGMTSIKEQLKIFDAKEEDMKLEVIDGEEVVTEVYRGKNTKGYVGKYPTNGFQCKCKNFLDTYYFIEN